MTKTHPILALLLLLALVPSCGGGGGGKSPPSSNGNSPLLASLGILDFGEVRLGDEKQISFSVSNPGPDPITLGSASYPSSDLSLVGTSFPIDLAVGGQADFTLAYAPTAIGDVTGSLRLQHEQSDRFLSIAVRATTGGQVVTDFGKAYLDILGRTPWLTVDVPADAISLTLEGISDIPSDTIGLADLIGPDNRTYVQGGSKDNYLWRKGTEIFSTTIPNTDRSELDLVPGGGTYQFRLSLLSGGSSRISVRAIVERRPGGDDKTATLDLNIWFGLTVGPTAATAANNFRLRSILNTMDSILSQQGIRLGDITYYDVGTAKYDDLTEAEMPEMLRLTSSAESTRVNLFFVNSVYNTTVVGASPTISGPDRNGTGESGLAVVYDGGLKASTIGAVAVHEIGHLLGLYHTVEADGTHDIIDDTPNCPAVGTNAECPRDGGGLLMHWEFLGGLTITNGEGKVIRGHPLMAPGIPSAGGLDGMVLLTLPSGDVLPAGWCAECSAR